MPCSRLNKSSRMPCGAATVSSASKRVIGRRLLFNISYRSSWPCACSTGASPPATFSAAVRSVVSRAYAKPNGAAIMSVRARTLHTSATFGLPSVEITRTTTLCCASAGRAVISVAFAIAPSASIRPVSCSMALCIGDSPPPAAEVAAARAGPVLGSASMMPETSSNRSSTLPSSTRGLTCLPAISRSLVELGGARTVQRARTAVRLPAATPTDIGPVIAPVSSTPTALGAGSAERSTSPKPPVVVSAYAAPALTEVPKLHAKASTASSGTQTSTLGRPSGSASPVQPTITARACSPLPSTKPPRR